MFYGHQTDISKNHLQKQHIVKLGYQDSCSVQFCTTKRKCKWKCYFPESKIHICGFVGNVDVGSGLTCYPYWTRFRPSRAHFWSKNRDFFLKKWFFWFFDKSAGSADINEKMLGKVVYNLFEPESII